VNNSYLSRDVGGIVALVVTGLAQCSCSASILLVLVWVTVHRLKSCLRYLGTGMQSTARSL